MAKIVSKFQFLGHNGLKNWSQLFGVTERNVAFNVADNLIYQDKRADNKFLRYGLKRENFKIQFFKYCTDPKTNNTIGILDHQNIYLAIGITLLCTPVAKLCPRSYFSVMAAAVSPRECVEEKNGWHAPESL